MLTPDKSAEEIKSFQKIQAEASERMINLHKEIASKQAELRTDDRSYTSNYFLEEQAKAGEAKQHEEGAAYMAKQSMPQARKHHKEETLDAIEKDDLSDPEPTAKKKAFKLPKWLKKDKDNEIER